MADRAVKSKKLILGLFGVLLIGAPVGVMWMSRARYDRLVALAQREGALVRPADLRRMYGDPVRGAEAARRIRSVLRPKAQSLRKLLDGPAPVSVAALAQARKCVAPLGDLDEFLALTSCDFDHEWERGVSMATPEFFNGEAATLSLTVIADAALERREYDRALQALRAAAKVGDLVGQTPTVFHVLMEARVYSLICDQIVRSAVRHRNDRRALYACRAALVMPVEIDYVRGLRGELWFALHTAENIDQFLDEANSPPLERNIPGVRLKWQLHHLEWARHVNSLIQRYPRDWRSAFTEAKSFEARQATASIGGPLVQVEYSMQYYLFPHVSQVFERAVRPECLRQMALAWLDVLERFNGTWPKSLPVERRDPYTSARLGIEVLAGGPVIWSPGPNGKAEYAPGRTEHIGDDVVLAIPQAIASRLK